ncbi:unnamed protein product, partial [Rotaria sordida]
MSQLTDDQTNVNEAWSWIIPIVDPSDFLYSNQNVMPDEQNEQPAEARAWSTYQSSNLENILGEGPTRQQKTLLTSTLPGQQQLKEDVRG